ncbi:MAG: agmatinase [Firmicutes bacterium ZCTH02-B6]|nr:MAG: agmatinase [Firmicutes bacterium ZCTH02-B6]
MDPAQVVPGTVRRQRFLGAVDDPGAPVVLLGAPLDTTVSFRPGTRFGPARIRDVSDGLEDYSPYLDLDFSQVPFFDAGDVDLPFGDPETALAAIERAVASVVDRGQLPIILGGEHLLTLATVRAVRHRFPDLVVLQFDAHADLRDDYVGVRHSHATVMRRIGELIGFDRVFQLGIRSGTREEFAFGRVHSRFHPLQLLPALERILPQLAGRPIYLTIDIDVVDPGFAPGTGTPEPGGVTPGELLAAVHRLRELQVVAMDVVEVCPPQDASDITAILAAKVVREAILGFGSGRQ